MTSSPLSGAETQDKSERSLVSEAWPQERYYSLWDAVPRLTTESFSSVRLYWIIFITLGWLRLGKVR